MFEKIKGKLNLIIGLGVFLVMGYIFYNSFIAETDNPDAIEVVDIADDETREIVGVLDKVKDINLDIKFFTEEPYTDGYILTFNEFRNFSQPIPNKRPGKVNPFIFGTTGVVQPKLEDQTYENNKELLNQLGGNEVQEVVITPPTNNNQENNQPQGQGETEPVEDLFNTNQ